MKLFVAKLNREVQDDHLVELFSQYGEVAYARVITDRETGQSKCFGFVQMREESAGQAALEALNGHELMGFKMVVKEAEDRPKSGSSSPSPSPRENNRGTDRYNADNGGERFQNPREFSRHEGSAADGPRETKKKSSTKKGRPKEQRDIYADGPKPARMKNSKPKNSDWLDDWEDY